MNQQPEFQIPPFTLYGLMGCPHCSQAENFLRVRSIPVNLVVANGDPIADAGIKAVTGSAAPQYPVLVNRVGNSIVNGFDEGKYREAVESYFSFISTSAPNVFGGGVQSLPQVPSQGEATPAVEGVN